MSTPETLHGWYSAKQAARPAMPFFFEDGSRLEDTRPCVYETPSGKRVVVTTVSRSKESHATYWDDVVYVGEVTHYVGKMGDVDIDLPRGENPVKGEEP